jgi:hypothetical protein
MSDQDWEEEPEGESLSVSGVRGLVGGRYELHTRLLGSMEGTAYVQACRSVQVVRASQANSCQAVERLLLFIHNNVIFVVCLLAVQNDGEDDEEPAATEGEEDEEGFVVGDGYLSDDEGMRDADEDAAPGAATCGASCRSTAALLTKSVVVGVEEASTSDSGSDACPAGRAVACVVSRCALVVVGSADRCQPSSQT